MILWSSNFYCSEPFSLTTLNRVDDTSCCPGLLTKVLRKEVQPRDPTPYSFIYQFWPKRCPLISYTFYWQMVPVSHTWFRTLHSSVKRKKSAEKQTRGLGPRERFTLPTKLLEYIRWEDTPMWYKFYTIISPGKRSIFQERNVFWLEASNISHHSLNRSKKNQIQGHTAAVVCQWIQAVNKFCWAHQSKLMLKRGVKLRSWCLLQSFFLVTEMKIVL